MISRLIEILAFFIVFSLHNTGGGFLILVIFGVFG